MKIGYPLYVPMGGYYYPYVADPCISGGMYYCNPNSVNTNMGAVGNCCAGACGGTAAAGACAGGV